MEVALKFSTPLCIPITGVASSDQQNVFVEENFEDSKEQRYVDNSNFAGLVEHLGIEMQVDIPCFDGFSHINKLQEWLKLVENYFEFMGIPRNEQVQMNTLELIKELYKLWEDMKEKRN